MSLLSLLTNLMHPCWIIVLYIFLHVKDPKLLNSTKLQRFTAKMLEKWSIWLIHYCMSSKAVQLVSYFNIQIYHVKMCNIKFIVNEPKSVGSCKSHNGSHITVPGYWLLSLYRKANYLVLCSTEVIAKTTEYPRHGTHIVLNEEKCIANYGRSIAGSPAFWMKEPITNR